MSGEVREALASLAYGPAPEDAGPALRWLDAHGRRLRLFVASRWAEPASGQWLEVRNPATADLLAHVPQAGPEDVEHAVRSARQAQPAWGQTPGAVRARYLVALARQVQKHARVLALLETLQSGKPIRETRDVELPLVARSFYYHAGWAQLLHQTFPGYLPVGVVGQVASGDAPLLEAAWKLAVALAAGCTVVLKPATGTPLTTLALCELALEVGLPPGAVNVITGDGRAGELLVRHPQLDQISFTGSAEVGRRIRQLTAGTGKRLSLELRGYPAFVVFEDADLDAAVEGVVDGAWSHRGRFCTGWRLLIQESVAEGFLGKLRARMEKLRVGDPLDRGVDMGALGASHLENARRVCEQLVAQDARLWQPSWASSHDGPYFPPTLVWDVSAGFQQTTEIPAPVVVTTTFRSPAEAVALANNTRYGLACSVWTENLSLALEVTRRVQAGTVWVNCVHRFHPASEAGGYRESGLGRQAGRERVWEYLKLPASPAFAWPAAGTSAPGVTAPAARAAAGLDQLPDRAPRVYVGGRRVLPEAPSMRYVYGPEGRLLGEVAEAGRKDVRNAVEAARTASTAWSAASGTSRAQVLFDLAENLQRRAGGLAGRLARATGLVELSRQEVAIAAQRLFSYAAWADKLDGTVYATAEARLLVLALREPLGVVGIACPDEFPLLALVSLLAPVVAAGNTAVVVPSQRHPLVAGDLYELLEASDVPGGVVNVLTGDREGLALVLAQHDDVDGLWYFGTPEGAAAVERESVGNLKRTWTCTEPRDWFDPAFGEGEEFLRRATQVKGVWLAHGD